MLHCCPGLLGTSDAIYECDRKCGTIEGLGEQEKYHQVLLSIHHQRELFLLCCPVLYLSFQSDEPDAVSPERLFQQLVGLTLGNACCSSLHIFPFLTSSHDSQL